MFCHPDGHVRADPSSPLSGPGERRRLSASFRESQSRSKAEQAVRTRRPLSAAKVQEKTPICRRTKGQNQTPRVRKGPNKAPKQRTVVVESTNKAPKQRTVVVESVVVESSIRVVTSPLCLGGANRVENDHGERLLSAEGARFASSSPPQRRDLPCNETQ